jgi:hypothetical protein
MSGKKIGSILFWLMVSVYILYAAVFIYKTIIVVNGQHYAVLFDDAMISMQYARNLAQGYGPVFNAGGDRVEGYSNPLWMVYMAFFHLLPIPTPYISLAIQISGAIFLVVNLILIRRITTSMLDSPSAWLIPLVAVGLTAFYYPLTNWSLLGVEVSILTLLASLVVWIVLNLLKEQKFSAWLYILLGEKPAEESAVGGGYPGGLPRRTDCVSLPVLRECLTQHLLPQDDRQPAHAAHQTRFLRIF